MLLCIDVLLIEMVLCYSCEVEELFEYSNIIFM